MEKRWLPVSIAFLLVIVGILGIGGMGTVQAAGQKVYYIDFESGKDTNDGMTPNSAWKHCPGDENAVDIPGNYTPQAGDIFRFKSGVYYRGTITVNADGNEEAPITYLGTGWGEGQAVIDGAERVSSVWKQCTSADDCGGNKNYTNIWYTDTMMEPAASGRNKEYSVNLHQEDEFLFVAQWPTLTDPFNYDNIRQFAEAVGGLTTMTATHPDLESIGGEKLVGQTVHVHNGNNAVSPRIIASYDDNTITFNEAINPNGYKHFAIANFEGLLSEPGQYTYRTNADQNGYHRIYLWPLNNADPNRVNVFLSTRECGIVLKNRKNVVIDGFRIIRNAASDNAKGSGIRANASDRIVIRNNLVEHIRQSSANYGALDGSLTNSIIENNTVRDNARRKGIFVYSSDNVIVRENHVENNGGTAVCGFGLKNSMVTDNTVIDNHGSHGNGMSFYLACDNILIARNTVKNSNMLLTFETSSNFYVYNNFFDGAGKINYLMNNRGTTGKFYFLNNTFVNSNNNLAVLLQNGEKDSEVIFKNNIVDGAAVGIPAHQDPSAVRTHNLYVGSMFKAPAQFYEGEIIDQTYKHIAPFSEQLVFVNPVIGAGDYRLLSASPARDSGTDVTKWLPKELFPDFDFDVDIEGNPRVSGGKWDMGAFEYHGKDTVKPSYFSLHTTTPTAVIGNEVEIELHASSLVDTTGKGDYEAVIQFNREYFARYAGYTVVPDSGFSVIVCQEMTKATGDWETESIYYYGKVRIRLKRDKSKALNPGAIVKLRFTVPDNETSNAAGATFFMIGRVTDETDGKKYSQGETVRLPLVPADGIIKPASVVINTSELSLENGQTATLFASVRPVNAVNKEIIWSSANPAVATVDSTGKITTKSIGETRITATVKGTELSVFCNLKVLIPFCATESLTLSDTELKFHIDEGGTRQLIATVLPSNATNRTVKWSVSDSKVLTVDGEGRITPVKAGSTTITARVENTELRAACKVTVMPPYVEATGIRVSYADQGRSPSVGKIDRLYGYTEPKDATNRNFTWASTNPQVISVTSHGGYADVMVIAKGEAEIILGLEGTDYTSRVKYNVKGATIQEKCDVNRDGIINQGDIEWVIAHYGKNMDSEDWTDIEKADISENNVIDLLDIVYISKQIQ